jgi:hypothetical protein
MKFKKKKYGDPTANLHIAQITGQKYHNRPFAWVSGDKKYTHITGGIVLPTIAASGFLLTVGVRHEDQKFELIEEFESVDDRKLLDKARATQKEYGLGVIENWWGDPEKLMSLVNKYNIETEQPIFISHPPDFQAKDKFQLYIISLQTALRRGNKVLYLGKCSKLVNHIDGFVPVGAREEDHPAVALAGWLVHTLNIYRPWEKAVESVRLFPTTPEDAYIYESEKATRQLKEMVYGIE